MAMFTSLPFIQQCKHPKQFPFNDNAELTDGHKTPRPSTRRVPDS